jgi:hypothetical protein
MTLITVPDITVELVDVNPTLAAAWLLRNTRNRTIKESAVDRYARDMSAGEWRVTGEAIKFDLDGDILDGQHRLLAVLKANTVVQLHVVRGLAPDSQDVMDTGVRRGAHDALHLNGYSNSTNLSAAAKLAMNYEAGVMVTAAQHQLVAVTNAEILRWVQANPDLVTAVAAVTNRKGKLPMRPSVGSFCLWAMRRIDAEQADELYGDLADMRTNGQGDPRYTLLRRLNTIRTGNERVSAVTEAHYIFRTWNALREGEELGNLKTGSAHGAFSFARPR